MKKPNKILKLQTSLKKVHLALKKRILDGTYSPGQQIRIADTAKEFNVSQTPVREALIQLTAENLIDYTPYKGAVVRGLSKEEVAQLFTIRTILECSAMRIGIENMDESDFLKAEKILMKIRQNNRPSYVSSINLEFHNCFYKRSNLPILCEMIQSLYSQVDRYLTIYYSFIDMNHFIDHHLGMIERGLEHDFEGSVEIMRQGIQHTATMINKYLSRGERE